MMIDMTMTPFVEPRRRGAAHATAKSPATAARKPQRAAAGRGTDSSTRARRIRSGRGARGRRRKRLAQRDVDSRDRSHLLKCHLLKLECLTLAEDRRRTVPLDRGFPRYRMPGRINGIL